MRLVYFDASGISASPPVQRGWSPVGEAHQIVPQPHCKRSILGALDFGANRLRHESYKQSVKRTTVVEFLDQTARQSDPSKMTIVVLDNARVHHDIDQEILDRWLVDHRMLLFYLPTYSPELNLIEIVWKHAKYHWRKFTTWTKETIDDEIKNLLDTYGSEYEIGFS